MKILRSLAMAALVLPIVACGDDDPPPPTVIPVVGVVNGSVSIEGEALSGVTVTLAGAASQTATSATDGSFSFQAVAAGTYTVSLSNLPTDATFTNPSQQVTIATQAQVVNADFVGNFIRTAAITGVVIIDEDPISGVAVAITGTETSPAQTTDNNGAFAFSALRAGTYTVSITSPAADANFGNLTQTVTLAVGQSAALTFAGFVPQEPTVSIGSITAGGLGLPVNPTLIAGQIDFTINFDAGDETAERVAIWLRDSAGTETEVAAQSFTTTGPGAAGVETVFSLLTAAVMANGVTPMYVNDDYTPFAVLTTVEGTTQRGEWVSPLTFANLDVLTVVNTTPAGSGVVAKARRWFGGTGGATYEARAIIYSSDITVSMIGVTASRGGAVGATLNATGTGLVSFGAGSGAESIVTGNPATFTVTAANNAGVVEDAFVQNFDANGNGVFDTADFGQTISISSIMDPAGVERLPDIQSSNPTAVVPLNGQLFDYVAPVPDQAAAVDTNGNGFTGDTGAGAVAADAAIGVAASELTFTVPAGAAAIDFDNDATLGVRWFSAGVAFAVSNVNELGVGFIGGSGRGPAPQVDMTLNVNDLIVPTTALFADVASSDDLAERTSAGFELEVTAIMDALGNSTAMAGGPVSTADDVAADNTSDEFGVDFGAVAYSLQAPVPNAAPASATGDPAEWIIFNNTNAGFPTPLVGGAVNPLHTILYTVDDPTLADTNAPAGINSGVGDIALAFNAVAAGPATVTILDGGAGMTTVPAAGFPANTATAIAVTFDGSASATGVGGGGIGGGGNAAYTVTATTTDQATAANSASEVWSMVLMDTPPTTAMVNPPPAAVFSSQAQLTFTIQGIVTNQAVVLVTGAAAVPLPLSAIEVVLSLAGGDGLCNTVDDADPIANFIGAVGSGATTGTSVSTAGPPFSRGFSVTTTEGASFAVDVTVSNPGGVLTVVDYCFQINAADSAVDNLGAADPLMSSAFTETIITWN